MKTTKQIKKSSKKKTAKKSTASVTIDKSLNVLSKRILFPKKLEKANRFLAKHGIPA
jgi:hypothetical protein